MVIILHPINPLCRVHASSPHAGGAKFPFLDMRPFPFLVSAFFPFRVHALLPLGGSPRSRSLTQDVAIVGNLVSCITRLPWASPRQFLPSNLPSRMLIRGKFIRAAHHPPLLLFYMLYLFYTIYNVIGLAR